MNRESSWQVSSKPCSTLRKIKKAPARVQRAKDTEEVARKRAGSQLPLFQECEFRGAVNSCSARRLPTPWVWNDLSDFVFAKFAAASEPMDIVVKCRRFHTIRQQAVSPRGQLSNRIVCARRGVANSTRRQSSCKSFKKRTNEAKESSKPNSQQSNESSVDDCRNPQGDQSAEYLREIQKESPPYKDKPDGYSGGKTSQKCPNDRENCSGCSHSGSESCEQNTPPVACQQPPAAPIECQQPQAAPIECQQPEAAPDERPCMESTFKLSKIISQIWRSCSKSIKPKKPPDSPQKPCAPPKMPEDAVEQDPPPPKFVHWSQKQPPCRRSCSSGTASAPMVFIPYQKSSKARRSKQRVPKTPSATVHPPECPCAKESQGNPRGTGTSTSRSKLKACMPSDTCKKPPLDTEHEKGLDEASGESCAAGTSNNLEGQRNFATMEVTCDKQPEAATSSKPNVSALKYRLTKCPSMKEMWQTAAAPQLPVTKMTPIERQKSCPPPREMVEPYKSSGEWRQQRYPIRLRIFKSTGTLDPCLPVIVDDWYHMVHTTVVKRSTEPHVEVHQRLVGDRRVRRAVQQRVKSRTKRDQIIKRGPSYVHMILDDERWPQMWYLNRGNGLDMNVQEAWAEGITGNGVVVTILDDGLEKDHPDLSNNYDPQASYDVNNHDEDPMPRYDLLDSNRHGTRCAGEVAATANNSICAVGVAFGAGIGGVRMLDGDVTDAVEARSLSLNPQHIDIYSASWGPDDDGKTVDGPGELATRAFIEGITKGRNGKGSIFVWASGNGGRDHDNCNCDGYTNSIWTLSISSATENGQVPWYSEACSSTLATTYSSGSTGEKQVVTTDLHQHCTSSHTGTSASAPLAAGICALALEANKELTWRDMQHIVVRTAKPANLKSPDWVTNGVGRNVSHSFGYGLMDAAAMVRLARRWRTVPEQHKCEVSAPHMGRPIPPKSQLTLELHVKECSGVNFLEHVQAKVSLMASRRGDLQIQLTSPQGTKSTLLAKRPHDVSKAGFNQWPFMSVHTWGERPHGTWKLEIHNEGRYQGRATLHEWALIFYGTSTLPDRTEYALYNPAGVSIPRRPFVKPRETAFSKAQNSLTGPKNKQPQHKSEKSGNLSPPYVVNAQIQSQRKGKARGQHKNGKSANKPTPRPTVQTLRGLTAARGPNPAGEVRLITSRPRGRSTPSPVTTTVAPTRPTTTTSTPRVAMRQRILNIVTASSLQRGLILLEPPAKPIVDNVPEIFQQYSKIQQLYPLYPVYAGVRGPGQHATRAKGLELLQDEQFDSKNFDKDTLEEYKLVFYGTETSLEFDDYLDRDKPGPPVNQQEATQDNTAIGARHNAVEAENGDPWTGSQQVERVSHPEVQRPTTENQTSGCSSLDAGRCLECKPNWYRHNGLCVLDCPAETYRVSDETKSACTPCHYSCLACSGPSDTECTACHEDSQFFSSFGDSQCVLRDLNWTMESTVWFYRMTILFAVNIAVLTVAAVYTAVSWYSRKKGAYAYSKVSYSGNGSAYKDVVRLQENGCLSDSE